MLDVQAQVDKARHDGRAQPKASPDEILAMFMRMLQRESVAGSQLLVVDLSASTAQLREIMAQELLKIMQQVPGFVEPRLSRPPTPEELKQLLKQLATLEKSGELDRHDAFKNATPEKARAGDSSPVAKAWSQFVQQAT